MQQLNALLDTLLGDLPVATLVFVAGVTLAIIAYCNGTISYDEAVKSILFIGGGSGAVGYVRNQAGKGVRKK